MLIKESQLRAIVREELIKELKESEIRSVIRQELINEMNLKTIGLPLVAAMMLFGGLKHSNDSALRDTGKRAIENIVQTSNPDATREQKEKNVRVMFHDFNTQQHKDLQALLLNDLRQDDVFKYTKGSPQLKAAKDLVNDIVGMSAFFNNSQNNEILGTLSGKLTQADVIEKHLDALNDAFKKSKIGKKDKDGNLLPAIENPNNVAVGLVSQINQGGKFKVDDLDLMNPGDIKALQWLDDLNPHDFAIRLGKKLAQTLD